jgi:hypothetical protein
MAQDKKTCELCGKQKKVDKMLEYYVAKRSDHDKIMYKCKSCGIEEQIEE